MNTYLVVFYYDEYTDEEDSSFKTLFSAKNIEEVVLWVTEQFQTTHADYADIFTKEFNGDFVTRLYN